LNFPYASKSAREHRINGKIERLFSILCTGMSEELNNRRARAIILAQQALVLATNIRMAKMRQNLVVHGMVCVMDFVIGYGQQEIHVLRLQANAVIVTAIPRNKYHTDKIDELLREMEISYPCRYDLVVRFMKHGGHTLHISDDYVITESGVAKFYVSEDMCIDIMNYVLEFYRPKIRYVYDS
jgi:hypothetical protein